MMKICELFIVCPSFDKIRSKILIFPVTVPAVRSHSTDPTLVEDEPGALEPGHGCQEQADINQEQDSQENQQDLFEIKSPQEFPGFFHGQQEYDGLDPEDRYDDDHHQHLLSALHGG
jgi:hypothetical protein